MPQTAEQTNIAIEFDNAAFSYDGAEFVFEHLNLRIAAGEFVCIVGGNGSGKSTLAKHMNALLSPTEGRVCVLTWNTSDTAHGFDIHAQVGLVQQNPDDQLVASLVENDVAFGPENLGIDASLIRQRIEQSLSLTGLAGFEQRETASLSGGQKQRCAIAGVLAMHPSILVLDESTAMLDPQGRADLMRVAKRLHAEGLTIVLITHFMDEAVQADRVIVMSNGRIVADGMPREVLTNEERLTAEQLEAPFAVRLSNKLRAEGVRIPVCLTETELEEALCALRFDR